MSEEPKVRPALTAEEWASVLQEDERLRDWARSDMLEIGSDHAKAALLLYGQPFGFTREMYDALDHLIKREGHRVNMSAPAAPALRDCLAALLPPR